MKEQELLLRRCSLQSLRELGKAVRKIVGPREWGQPFNWLSRKRDLHSKGGPAKEGRVAKAGQKNAALKRAKLGQMSTEDLLADYFIF